MSITSIQTIRSAIDTIENNLSDFKIRLKQEGHLLGSEIGTENEYTISSLMDGISNILIDLKYLVRVNRVFVKISTVDERNSIASHLTNLNANLNNYNWQTSINNLDALKVILRSYHIRDDKERYIEFSETIDDLIRKREEIDERYQDIGAILNKTNAILEEIVGSRE